jgi:hypothetical protein
MSQQTADKPSEPGWYECACEEMSGDRYVMWWNGSELSDHSGGMSCGGTYTDFRGPLVPAAELAELRAAAEAAIKILHDAHYDENNCKWCEASNKLRAALAAIERTEPRREGT